MINKIFAPFSLVLLIIFMTIILIYVPRIELVIIVIVCSGMAIYDFWRSFQPGGDAHENETDTN
ncbi:MAG: hypothetical protein ACKVHL_03925 [Rhodospirillales bacterium]|jgi:hypothetical protein